MRKRRHRVEVALDDQTFREFERVRGTMTKQAYLARAVMRSLKRDEQMRVGPGRKRDRS